MMRNWYNCLLHLLLIILFHLILNMPNEMMVKLYFLTLGYVDYILLTKKLYKKLLIMMYFYIKIFYKRIFWMKWNNLVERAKENKDALEKENKDVTNLEDIKF